MKPIARHLSYANAAATLAVVLALSSGAAAATGAFTGSSGKLQACINGGGELRLLKAGKRCKSGQRLVSWNQAGPAGPKGAPGAQGPAGPAGPAGVPGLPLSRFGRKWTQPASSSPPAA